MEERRSLSTSVIESGTANMEAKPASRLFLNFQPVTRLTMLAALNTTRQFKSGITTRSNAVKAVSPLSLLMPLASQMGPQ